MVKGQADWLCISLTSHNVDIFRWLLLLLLRVDAIRCPSLIHSSVRGIKNFPLSLLPSLSLSLSPSLAQDLE